MSEKNIQRVLLFAFSLSGAAALIYEVVWTRALSLILGSTVYALSTMLATFMAGLALGAYLGGKLADKNKNLIFYFGLFELGIGVAGLITVPVIYSLPPLYFRMYKALHLSPNLYFVSQFLLSAGIMLVPTTLMGATFPVVSRRITAGMEEMGRKVGDAYSFNTLGAIAGSLSAGFLLIPLLGIKWSSFTAGCLNIAVGTSVVLLSGRFKKGLLTVLLVPLGASLLTAGATVKDSMVTFYMADRYEDIGEQRERLESYDKLLDRDYAEGTVRVYSYGQPFLMVQHGGKMEGTALKDIENTVLLAALPASVLKDPPADMLVIGLGAGVTVFAGRHVAREVSVVEINPGVVEAVTRFSPTRVLDGVRVYRDDARRLISVSDAAYDIITSEPAVPSESVSANLYAREFYGLAAKRLRKGGVFCQGLPGWNMTRKDLDVCVKTFASVFEYVYVWQLNNNSGDLLMIGSMGPLPFTHEEIMARIKNMDLSITLNDPPLLLFWLPEDVREIAAKPDIPLNTDDRPYIEFASAKNFLYGVEFREMRR